MLEGEYKFIKTNSMSSFDEKTIKVEDNTVLAFDESLNPKPSKLLDNINEPPAEHRIYGTRWYCQLTDRIYTWMGAWIDLHNTFPSAVLYLISSGYEHSDYEEEDYE